MYTQGEKAVLNGNAAQRLIKETLFLQGFQLNSATTLEQFKNARATLWQVNGQYAEQCEVPLVASCHKGQNRKTKVDFVALSQDEFILISVKSQITDGTADEKLEYEVQQLIATEQHAAMVVIGPTKGRDAPHGWRSHILEEIWERAKSYGKNKVLLFRSPEKLARWINDGMPVGGLGITPSEIFSMYCDEKP